MPDPSDYDVLYEHSRRPEWGLAVLTSEDRTSRSYQFTDGKIRVFKEGYYDLLTPTARPAAEQRQARDDLDEMLRRAESKERLADRTKSDGRLQISVASQVSLFRKLFPGGFEDPGYLERVRGLACDSSGRNGGPDAARALLLERVSEAVLNNLASAEDWATLYDLIIQGLHTSEIVSSSSDIRPLRRVPDEERAAVCKAFVDLIYGKGDFGVRFDAFVMSVDGQEGGRATWPMCTVVLGLLHPSEHYCIKPSVFRQQARFLIPDKEYAPHPTAAGYEEYRAMAEDLKERITKAGLAPKDNLDVYGFIFETMRPGLKEQYAALGG